MKSLHNQSIFFIIGYYEVLCVMIEKRYVQQPLVMVICFLEFCFGGGLTQLAAKQGNLQHLIYSTSLCRCGRAGGSHL